MTLLKPSYNRAKIDLPPPPENKSLLHYALTLSHTALHECINPELFKLILLRARKKFKINPFQDNTTTSSGTSGGNSSSSGSSSTTLYNTIPTTNNTNTTTASTTTTSTLTPLTWEHQTETQRVYYYILNQYILWCRDEYRIRLVRTIRKVTDRIEQLHRFRLQLILNIHEKYIKNEELISMNETKSSSNWFYNLSSNNSSNDVDIQYQRNLRQKFPFLTLQNPVFFDTPVVLLNTKHGIFDSAAAILHNNSGNIYITIDYFMYYSTSSIFSNNSEIVVIPLRSVRFMELVDVDSSIVVRCSYEGDGSSNSSSTGGGGGTTNTATTASTVVGDSSNNTTTPTTTTTTTTPQQYKPTPNAHQPHTIRLIDSTGTIDITVEVTGLTLDYTRRVFDLLDLIIKVSSVLYMVLLCYTVDYDGFTVLYDGFYCVMH